MLVARLPADGDRRALADRVGLRARDTDAYVVASGVADDEHAVAVVDDHANLDRQAVRKPRAVADQLKTLGAQEHVGRRAREVLAGVGIRLDRPEAIELDAPRRGRVDATGEEVAVADELAHESGSRVVIHLERRRRLLERAVTEDRDAVRHRHRLGLVVRHVHHRDADLAVDALELDLHLLAQLLVQRAERLVQQEHVRVEDEAPRERDALLLAAGELARMPVGEPAQPDQVEDFAHALSSLRLRKRAHAQRKGDVALDRHVWEQRVVLEDDADVALVRLAARQIFAVELDDAAGGLLETRDHHQRRRLPGAARAEEREELALRDVEADPVDSVDAAVVGLHETVEPQVGQCQAPPRGTMSASTTTQPAPVSLTTIGFTSSSPRLSRSVHAKSPIASSARASAPTSPGGRPRKPPSKVATRVSAIIACASPARRGNGRSATSSSASISTPPAPNARTRPKSGSRLTPPKTSRIPCAISWIRNPATSCRRPRSSTRRESRTQAAPSSVSSRSPTATRPTSDRCGIASDTIFSATG